LQEPETYGGTISIQLIKAFSISFFSIPIFFIQGSVGIWVVVFQEKNCVTKKSIKENCVSNSKITKLLQNMVILKIN
jgi:hypothetical protein